MQKSGIKISVIVVNYRVEKELFTCIKSIYTSDPKVSFEIIIVDNSEEDTLYKRLSKAYPDVIYVKTNKNIGYGAGNNLGSKHASGDYLFFLNPDTKVCQDSLDTLVDFYKINKNIGIVAPLLLDKNNTPYPLQGSTRLGPLEGVVALSFLNTWFPGNPISMKYFLKGWNKKDIKEVDCVPGTAFVIRRNIFERTGGFDEHLFLYFEEHDICNRVKKLNIKIYINPNARVVHEWEKSTRQRKDIDKIFAESRFYYFKKHFGILPAIFVHAMTSVRKSHILLLAILFIGSVARFYKLSELMPFIGDYAWFYLSARDMLLTGNIPLVGITSSHTWLHQGPLWTYLLAVVLYLFQFDPVSGAYFIAAVGVCTIWLVYKISKELFSERVGLIASALYAASPLVILHSRISYHTSLIPFFTILTLYSLYKWVKGNIHYFPLILFFLSVLYNLELATVVLWFIFLFFLMFGLRKKKKWVREVIHKKIILFSLLAFIIPMLPIIMYDISHGFKQTLVFGGWVIYRLVLFFNRHAVFSNTFTTMSAYFFSYNQKLLFILNGIVSLFIVVPAFFNLINVLHKMRNKFYIENSYSILFLFLFIPILGFFISATPSEAYIPVLFPALMIATALLFDRIMNFRRLYFLVIFLIITLSFFNIYYLISQNYFTGKGMYGPTFKNRTQAAKHILQVSKGKRYSLVGKGEGSQFESFTMNYEYLLWRMGHPPSSENIHARFVIEESKRGIEIHENKNSCMVPS